MIRILFVDDDQDVLAGLRNRLRSQRSRWEMMFVQSGHEALEELEQAPFDVVVSDMRMPIMDGAQLLAEVKARHPDVARIVLSGDAERDVVLRTLPIVHQFLTKPCDGNVLKAAIERACLLRSILCDPALAQLIGELGPLPQPPPLYRAMVQATHDPMSDGAALARLLAGDARASADVARLIVAAGLDGRDALAPLILQSLTIAAALFAPVAGDAPSLPGLAERALRAARLSRRLVAPAHAETAFAAALLGHVGEIVLTRALPGRLRSLSVTAAADPSAAERRRAALGTTTSELSAALLSQWSFSPPVVELVAFRHRVEVAAFKAGEAFTAVELADELAGGGDLDDGLIQRADAQLPGWRELAARAPASGE